jgi:hypothetical protein
MLTQGLRKNPHFFSGLTEICLMRVFLIFAIFLSVGFTASLTAGPEIYDPLEAYKKANNLGSRPSSEKVTQGTNTEWARFSYENGMLVRADYFGLRNMPTGHTLYTYDNGILVAEQLFDASGILTEDIRYQYRKNKLEKTLIHDLRGDARIEWHYGYDKAGQLVSGRRLIDKKVTESFKLVPGETGVVQQIYNAKGELTSRVDSVYENGLLRQRVKTGLTGTRFAEYRYNEKKQLIEIIYHDTVRGEKTFVKKHQFDYSLNQETQNASTRLWGQRPETGHSTALTP